MKTNKKVLVVILVAVLVLSVFAGCTPSGSSTTSAPPTTSGAVDVSGSTAPSGNYRDTIIIGENGEPKNLDPDEAWGNTEARYSAHIHEGLVREDINGNPVPLLAESWTISDDQLVYTFKLKPDVKFSNGKPVTGADWVWSIERARDSKVSNSTTVVAAVSKVEAPDDTTLVITLDKPVASFIANLCKWNCVVKSKEHFDTIGAEAFLTNPLGTGPYAVTEWKRGEYIKLAANEYYHIEGKPYTKNMIYRIITDDNTRLMQLQAGQIDIMPNIPVNMMEQIDNDANLKADSFTGAQIRYIVINATDDILKNQKVRTALSYATDKQELLDLVVYGHGKVVTSFISDTHGDLYNPNLKERGGNAEEAKKILAEAGYPDGITLKMSIYGGNSIYENIATILQSQWAKAGIKLELSSLESGTLIESLQALNYQTTLLQWTESVPDPTDIGAYACRYAESQQWYSGLNDTAMDALYMSTVAEMDRTKRAELFWQLQQSVYDNSTIIPIFQADFTYASSAKVQDLIVTPFNRIDSASLRILE